MKNKLLIIGIITLVIITIGFFIYNNYINIPSSEDKIVVKQSKGAGMLSIECANKSYVTETSDYIIEGTIENVESKWNPENNFIFTYSDFKIEKYIKGNPFEEETIQIITDGGCVGDICQNSEDGPTMSPGKKRLYIVIINGEYNIHGCGGVVDIIDEPEVPPTEQPTDIGGGQAPSVVCISDLDCPSGKICVNGDCTLP